MRFLSSVNEGVVFKCGVVLNDIFQLFFSSYISKYSQKKPTLCGVFKLYLSAEESLCFIFVVGDFPTKMKGFILIVCGWELDVSHKSINTVVFLFKFSNNPNLFFSIYPTSSKATWYNKVSTLNMSTRFKIVFELPTKKIS